MIRILVLVASVVTIQAHSQSPQFSPAPGSPFRAGPGAYNLAVGDFNKDGKPDVVASSFVGNAVTMLLGR